MLKVIYNYLISMKYQTYFLFLHIHIHLYILNFEILNEDFVDTITYTPSIPKILDVLSECTRIKVYIFF